MRAAYRLILSPVVASLGGFISGLWLLLAFPGIPTFLLVILGAAFALALAVLVDYAADRADAGDL
jgi:hypothetical protein